MNSKFKLKDIPELVKETLKAWFKDRPLDQSANVSFYSIFAMPGLLMIIITIAGSVFGQEAVEGKIEKEISEILGRQAGKGIQNLIANIYTQGHSKISTMIGIIILLFAASGVFSALQRSLNKTWNKNANIVKSSIKKSLLNRAISFGMIIVIGLLLLVSLVLSSMLSLLGNYIKMNYSYSLLNILHVVNFVFSFGLITIMFAILYKFLPSVKIPWKCAYIGAALTSILYYLGKFSISIYYKTVQPGSAYGVAGFFILLILWITYSSLAIFLGAKFIFIINKRYFNE